jgi:hypothetical protein
VPRWLVNRLQNLHQHSGPIARYFEHLARQDAPAARRFLIAIDHLQWEDNLLETLAHPQWGCWGSNLRPTD